MGTRSFKTGHVLPLGTTPSGVAQHHYAKSYCGHVSQGSKGVVQQGAEHRWGPLHWKSRQHGQPMVLPLSASGMLSLPTLAQRLLYEVGKLGGGRVCIGDTVLCKQCLELGLDLLWLGLHIKVVRSVIMLSLSWFGSSVCWPQCASAGCQARNQTPVSRAHRLSLQLVHGPVIEAGLIQLQHQAFPVKLLAHVAEAAQAFQPLESILPAHASGVRRVHRATWGAHPWAMTAPMFTATLPQASCNLSGVSAGQSLANSLLQAVHEGQPCFQELVGIAQVPACLYRRHLHLCFGAAPHSIHEHLLSLQWGKWQSLQNSTHFKSFD